VSELDRDIASIAKYIHDGKCIPFLGAGASMGPTGGGLPSGPELARQLAAEVSYPGADPGDFLRVCQFYEGEKDPYTLRQSIFQKINLADIRPGNLHKKLAALPVQYVLTTNFDNLMERAFRLSDKDPVTSVYDIRKEAIALPKPSIERPLVYKLHGTTGVAEEDIMSMLCTEDDAIEFTARLVLGDPRLPEAIKHLFTTYHSFLFIGYGLRDWNIRSMFRALRGRSSGKDFLRSFAVQPAPVSPANREWASTVRYYDRKENVKVIEMTASAFIDVLYDYYQTQFSEKITA
jgi:SIR2-like domain